MILKREKDDPCIKMGDVITSSFSIELQNAIKSNACDIRNSLSREYNARFEELKKTIDEKVNNSNNDILFAFASNKVFEKISPLISNFINSYIESNYGAIERKVDLIINSDTVKSSKEVYHKAFDMAANIINSSIPLYLYGESGTGKNVLSKQIAEALKLDFYYTNCITDEFNLRGFTDANGNYQESQFYKAFTKGGLFMIDELDASIPEALIILNSAIANGYFDFPAPIGKVEAHKDFRVIAAGNTKGTGATMSYSGRNIIDQASLDRFYFLEIDYDINIELSISKDKDIVNLVHEIRKIAKENNIQEVISYRSLLFFNKLKSLYKEDVSGLIRDTIFKNFSPKNKKVIRNYLAGKDKKNKYQKDAINALNAEDKWRG